MVEATVHQEANHLVLEGVINFDTVVQLRKAGDRLIKKMDAPVIDFKHIRYCDSTGLSLMMAWLRGAKKSNKSIAFLHVPLSLQTISEVCGVSKILGLK